MEDQQWGRRWSAILLSEYGISGCLSALCLVTRPRIRIRHILKELLFKWFRINQITSGSLTPHCEWIVSNVVLSSQAR